MKKIFKITAISFIAIWFVCNLGLYVYFKYSFNQNVERIFDYFPEPLVIKESAIKAEQLSLMGFKIKFPFYKEDISSITPFFFDQQLQSISIKAGNIGKIPYINFNALPDRWDNQKSPLLYRIWNTIIYKENSLSDFIYCSYHARLKDYSWWNLPGNIRLTKLLIEKAILLSSYYNFNVYDVETPYIKGLLVQGYSLIGGTPSKRAMVDFGFEWKNKRYNITFIGVDSNNLIEARKILSTIQPIQNIEDSYNEMKGLYSNKASTLFPEELLLVSILSIKNLSIDELEQLLKIMIIKNNKDYIIDPIKEEIKYLKDNTRLDPTGNKRGAVSH